MSEPLVVDDAAIEQLKHEIDVYASQLRKAGDEAVSLVADEFGRGRIPTLAEWNPSVDSSLENLRDTAYAKSQAIAQDSVEMAKALESLKDTLTQFQAQLRDLTQDTASSMSAIQTEG